jgi:iporin
MNLFPSSYRDGVQHHSILSSLSASYNGIGELSYYDDLAKNLDANLAEVDMENFRSEQEEGGNPTRKLILKDQTEFDNSICKSEILFSPVKESHISVDSLDMDGYPDDIILTCQANKNNYTIAFEGSCMYSDDSYYGEFLTFQIELPLTHFPLQISQKMAN